MTQSYSTTNLPMRFQSQLGKEFRRRYKEENNLIRLTLARVVKVNYKYNTVDVVTVRYGDTLVKNPTDEGKFSARLPISFGGRTPDGKVYGANTLVTVGSLVLVGFLEGKKEYPIVLNIYGELDNQSMLTRTELTGADEADEAIQREIWQLFTLYPSMTYRNIDGRGNQEITFSGKSFMYITDTDQENEYVTDYGFDYDHLPSAYYANGELIEPTSPKSPTLIYVHQGVYDNHRVTFFIKSDGTVRVGSRHLDGGGITFQELKTDGSHFIVQKRGTINPEEPTEKFSRIGIRENGEVVLEAKGHTLEVTNKGILINGKPIAAIGGGGSVDLREVQKRIDDINEKVIDANASIDVLEEVIALKADATTVNDVKKTLTEHEAQFKVAFDEINSKVSKAVYDVDLKALREYAEELFGEVNTEIEDVIRSVTDLDRYIEGSFQDGIIEKSEAIAIKNYIKLLETEKKDVDSRFNEIYYNPHLPDTDAEQLSQAKIAFDTAHAELIQAIENAIVDEKISPLEAEQVDIAFANYGEAIARLTKQFESAIDTIAQAKAKGAEFNAKSYADALKSAVDTDIQDVQGRVGDLNEYVNGAFHDGVIEESEARAIAKYINTLQTEKLDMDERFKEIYYNNFLDEPEKSELYNRKMAFNVAHDELIDAINIAIEDMKTTVEESNNVNLAFQNYSLTLGDLARYYEIAIDKIASNKATAAEQAAKEHANSLRAKTESEIKQLADEINLRVTSETFTEVVETITTRVEGTENKIVDVERDLEEVSNNLTFRAEIISTNGNVFRNGNIDTTLFCRVYRGSQDITDTIDASKFVWYRVSDDPVGDEAWNTSHRNAGKSVRVTAEDVRVRATFNCDIIE